ncbi:hypothetical protein RFI_36521 [Reticulomyxa filosa]|uniref:Caspase family p20 domain-containing protein n=1 Tax=Reticulomyxa filosa TaxID=46433 RepID=X6LH67_RETFI|nr:hypothetical protein RFI_36521 [Reticulomyxa filosa]|eukprot:ETO00919.1 hypothetical protein RFI_36521 [Reticulomyxa filosa]
MTKDEIDEFIDKVKSNFKLRKNTNEYDGIIIIICGHRENGNMLVTSNGKFVSIDEMFMSFNCYKMEAFKIFQKYLLLVLVVVKILQNLTNLQCEKMKYYMDIMMII